MVDSKEVSKMFGKFKQNGILEQPIKMHMNEYIRQKIKKS